MVLSDIYLVYIFEVCALSATSNNGNEQSLDFGKKEVFIENLFFFTDLLLVNGP